LRSSSSKTRRNAIFNITLERDFADVIAPIELVPQDITRVCLKLIGNGFYAATKRQREGRNSKLKPQSMETDQEKRKRLVWEIDRRLLEDQARPIVYHLRFATCWQPKVKGLRMMVNSVFNGWRFEDV